MNIGEVIKTILKRKKITQLELSTKIGKSQTAISQILNGVYNPNSETLKKISEAIEVPVPVLNFLTISEKDIPEDKLELYRLMHPMMTKYLTDIYMETET